MKRYLAAQFSRHTNRMRVIDRVLTLCPLCKRQVLEEDIKVFRKDNKQTVGCRNCRKEEKAKKDY